MPMLPCIENIKCEKFTTAIRNENDTKATVDDTFFLLQYTRRSKTYNIAHSWYEKGRCTDTCVIEIKFWLLLYRFRYHCRIITAHGYHTVIVINYWYVIRNNMSDYCWWWLQVLKQYKIDLLVFTRFILSWNC